MSIGVSVALGAEVERLRAELATKSKRVTDLGLAVVSLRAELAESKKEIALLKTPNLVWDFNEPEESSTDSILDGVYQHVDWVGGEEAIGKEVSFLTARKLPNVTVRITSVNDDGEVTFEEIDAAMAGGEQ